MGQQAIIDSGIGDDFGFVPQINSPCRRDHENIFVLGDASNIPTSKAGSVVHFASSAA